MGCAPPVTRRRGLRSRLAVCRWRMCRTCSERARGWQWSAELRWASLRARTPGLRPGLLCSRLRRERRRCCSRCRMGGGLARVARGGAGRRARARGWWLVMSGSARRGRCWGTCRRWRRRCLRWGGLCGPWAGEGGGWVWALFLRCAALLLRSALGVPRCSGGGSSWLGSAFPGGVRGRPVLMGGFCLVTGLAVSLVVGFNISIYCFLRSARLTMAPLEFVCNVDGERALAITLGSGRAACGGKKVPRLTVAERSALATR